jgi:hypothetical protein
MPPPHAILAVFSTVDRASMAAAERTATATATATAGDGDSGTAGDKRTRVSNFVEYSPRLLLHMRVVSQAKFQRLFYSYFFFFFPCV